VLQLHQQTFDEIACRDTDGVEGLNLDDGVLDLVEGVVAELLDLFGGRTEVAVLVDIADDGAADRRGEHTTIVSPATDRLTLVEASLLDYEALADAVEGVEAVLHQAAIPSVPRSFADPVATMRANVEGTTALLEACRKADVRRVAIASSSSVYGDTPERMMPFIADGVLRQNTWQLVFTVGTSNGSLRPLLVLSPILVETIARAGWSKQDVKQYLFDHARLPAWQFERYLGEWTDHPIRSLKDQANLGKIPKLFYESDDPERMVPIVFEPDDFMIVVAGDLLRTNCYTFAHNGILGYPVAKKIALPEDWSSLLAGARSG